MTKKIRPQTAVSAVKKSVWPLSAVQVTKATIVLSFVSNFLNRRFFSVRLADFIHNYANIFSKNEFFLHGNDLGRESSWCLLWYNLAGQQLPQLNQVDAGRWGGDAGLQLCLKRSLVLYTVSKQLDNSITNYNHAFLSNAIIFFD